MIHTFYYNYSDHGMEVEFEKTPSLATKLKGIQNPQDHLFNERNQMFYNDLEMIVRISDNIS